MTHHDQYRATTSRSFGLLFRLVVSLTQLPIGTRMPDITYLKQRHHERSISKSLVRITRSLLYPQISSQSLVAKFLKLLTSLQYSLLVMFSRQFIAALVSLSVVVNAIAIGSPTTHDKSISSSDLQNDRLYRIDDGVKLDDATLARQNAVGTGLSTSPPSSDSGSIGIHDDKSFKSFFHKIGRGSVSINWCRVSGQC